MSVIRNMLFTYKIIFRYIVNSISDITNSISDITNSIADIDNSFSDI